MKRTLIALVLSLGAGATYGQSISNGLFSYAGGAPSNLHVPTWQPNNGSDPGMHFLFWGAPDPQAGCVPNTVNGTTTTDLSWTSVQQDTGLSVPDPSLQWSPISIPGCTYSNWQGFTHAHLNTNASGGGFGLYTYTGPKPYDNSPSFWQPYPSTGDRFGSNAYIQDTYGSFPLDTRIQVMRPFSSPGQTDWDLLRFAYVSYQHVEHLVATDLNSQQIRQQMKMNLVNRACQAEGKMCQFELLFYTAMVGLGVPGIFDAPFVYGDPAQGGGLAVGGGIPSYGGSVYYNDGYGTSVPFYTSWAEPTQTAPWASTKRFQIEISFNQLQNILKAATAKFDGVPMSQATDCTKYFGTTCMDPNAWQLAQAGVSQEAYNQTYSVNRAYVGGYTTELDVIALPLY